MDSPELASLLKTYRDELKSFFIMFLITSTFIALVTFGGFYTFSYVFSSHMDWSLATLVWLIQLLPLFKALYPEKPTAETAAYNKVLNDIARQVHQRDS